MCVCVLRPGRLFAAPWTVAHQAPLSIRFPRQEYCCHFPLQGIFLTKLPDIMLNALHCLFYLFCPVIQDCVIVSSIIQMGEKRQFVEGHSASVAGGRLETGAHVCVFLLTNVLIGSSRT